MFCWKMGFFSFIFLLLFTHQRKYFNHVNCFCLQRRVWHMPFLCFEKGFSTPISQIEMSFDSNDWNFNSLRLFKRQISIFKYLNSFVFMKHIILLGCATKTLLTFVFRSNFVIMVIQTIISNMLYPRAFMLDKGNKQKCLIRKVNLQKKTTKCRVFKLLLIILSE